MEEQKKDVAKLVFDQKDIDDNKIVAAIGYLGILALVPLLAKKESRFCMFHGKQGLVIFIAEILLSFMNVIPFLGPVIWTLGMLACGAFSVWGIINAATGKSTELPIVGDVAKKINL